jgi:hypothetical protein
MRSEQEIKQALESLMRHRQTILDNYNQFIDFQGNKNLRDERLPLSEAAAHIEQEMWDLRRVSKAIDILKWATGELENLPWR